METLNLEGRDEPSPVLGVQFPLPVSTAPLCGSFRTALGPELLTLSDGARFWLADISGLQGAIEGGSGAADPSSDQR